MLQFLIKAWPLILVAAPGIAGLSLLRLHTFQVKELKLKILELEKRLSDGESVVIMLRSPKDYRRDVTRECLCGFTFASEG